MATVEEKAQTVINVHEGLIADAEKAAKDAQTEVHRAEGGVIFAKLALDNVTALHNGIEANFKSGEIDAEQRALAKHWLARAQAACQQAISGARDTREQRVGAISVFNAMYKSSARIIDAKKLQLAQIEEGLANKTIKRNKDGSLVMLKSGEGIVRPEGVAPMIKKRAKKAEPKAAKKPAKKKTKAKKKK